MEPTEVAIEPKKFPLGDMRVIAEAIVKILKPYCHRIEIAGSIRRERPFVKDIEVVVIPKIVPTTNTEGLFPEEGDEVNLLDQFILSNDDFALRVNIAGHTAYGEKNKLVAFKGIPLDIFVATEENWPMIFFVRTGGKDNNRACATRAIEMGYELKMYECGFRHKATGQLVTMRDDRDIYDFLGVPYLAPNQRK